MSKGKHKVKQKIWLVVGLVVAILPLIAYLVIDLLYGGKEQYNRIRGEMSGWLVLLSLTTFIISLMTCFKLKKWQTLIPIIGVILSLVIALLAYFVYSFSSYPN